MTATVADHRPVADRDHGRACRGAAVPVVAVLGRRDRGRLSGLPHRRRPRTRTTRPPFRFFTDVRDWVDANRDTSPLFLYGVNYLRLGVALLVDAVQGALVRAGLRWAWSRRSGAIAAVLAGWRTALLAVAGFVCARACSGCGRRASTRWC